MSKLKEIYCPKCKTISIFEEYGNPKKLGYYGGEKCRNCNWNNKAGGKQISIYNYHPFIKKCSSCKKEKMLLTRADNHSEYTTDVGLICKCGQIIWFSLPVN